MRRLNIVSAIPLMAFVTLIPAEQHTDTAATEIQAPVIGPITAVGHGAMFDTEGREIRATPAFILDAQRFYLDSLVQRPDEKQRAAFRSRQERLLKAAQWTPQERMYLNSVLLAWLIDQVQPANSTHLRSINAFLRQESERIGDVSRAKPRPDRAKLVPSERMSELLRREGMTLRSATTLGGAAYISQCGAAGVPIPPDWGSTQWKSRGILTNEFISGSLEAEVFTFESSAPRGICFALPRSSGNTIALLGIICLGSNTSNACFWDNQKNDQQFPIQKSTSVPLSQFAGGAELEGGTGGVCTGCHTGENPFVIHPGTPLDVGAITRTNNGVVPGGVESRRQL